MMLMVAWGSDVCPSDFVALPGEGTLRHEVEGPPHLADRVHAVEHPTGAEAILGGLVPVADSAEDVLLRDAHVVVDDLAVVRCRPPPDADAAHDPHALRGGRPDELPHGAFAPLGPFSPFGPAGHHHEQVG